MNLPERGLLADVLAGITLRTPVTRDAVGLVPAEWMADAILEGLVTEQQRDTDARMGYVCPLCAERPPKRCVSQVDGHRLKRSHLERMELVRETS